VIRAIARLKPALRKATHYVVAGTGDDNYREKLTRLAGETGVALTFVGEVQDDVLRALYATASVFCMPGTPHPHKVEGFGLAYLEAAAQKLPSIGSDLGAVPEVVKNGETGVIIRAGHTDELTRALAKTLGEDDFRQKLGQQAHENARRYTWENTALATYGALV
jgi:phosphatidylinositol alpha-1,6-mannosyltransferase